MQETSIHLEDCIGAIILAVTIFSGSQIHKLFPIIPVELLPATVLIPFNYFLKYFLFKNILK